MVKDGSIYIKIEITRDKKNNNLNIVTRLDKNAPNVFEDKDGLYWIPTQEEKDLLNDSFDLMPSTNTLPSLNKIEIKSIPKPETNETEKNEIEKPDTLPKIETPSPQVEVKPSPPIELPQEEKTASEKTKYEETADEKEETAIKKADDQAIENALKKHIEENEDDDSIVQADEQTIIDKVLKQKKKWKK